MGRRQLRLGSISSSLVSNPALLQGLADSIEAAAEAAPAGWGLTSTAEMIRLNVGPIEVFTILVETVRVMVDARRPRLPPKYRSSTVPFYPSVPGSAAADLRQEDFDRLYPALRDAHLALIQAAASVRGRYTWKRAHSPKMLAEVARLVGRALPEPDYDADTGHDQVPRPLFEKSVYTIVREDLLRDAERPKGLSKPLTERKRWVEAERMLKEAKAKGLNVPILFADSTATSRFLGWAILVSVAVTESGTRYRFRSLRPLPSGASKRDLFVPSIGRRLSPDHIRPYVICRTPEFLDGALEDVESAVGHEPALDLDDAYGVEGEVTRRLVLHRGRERALREKKLAQAKRVNGGRLICQAPGCGFDFEAVYGHLGRDFAVVHHVGPLADRASASKTRLQDLAVVCANCHAMIHRGGQCRDLAELVVRRSGSLASLRGRP